MRNQLAHVELRAGLRRPAATPFAVQPLTHVEPRRAATPFAAQPLTHLAPGTGLRLAAAAPFAVVHRLAHVELCAGSSGAAATLLSVVQRLTALELPTGLRRAAATLFAVVQRLTRLELFVACVLLAGCRGAAPRARLDDAAGLAPGSRVYAAGIHIGNVERVTLVEARAEVRLTLSEGHTLAPRADACALVLDANGAPTLLVFPGKELASLEGPIPSCEVRAKRPELQRLSESANEVMRAGARRALLVLDLQRDAPPAGPCDALAVSRLRTELVEPVALLLPGGGRRLWLSVENRARTPVALETATFLDQRGTVAPQARLPETDDLFLSVSIPAGARREVSAVFEGQRAAQVQTIEVEAAYADSPNETCRARWRL